MQLIASKAMEKEKGRGVKRAHEANFPGDIDAGVQGKLKLVDVGKSFCFPCPTPLEDPTKDKLLSDSEYKDDDSAIQALNKESSSILEPSEEEEETHCINEEEEPPTNVAELEPFGSPLSLQSIPMKPASEECKVIPNELQINDGWKSLSYPHPSIKVPMSQLLDPTQYEKNMHDAFNEGRRRSAQFAHIRQAYQEAKEAAGFPTSDADYSHFSYETLDGRTIEMLVRDSGDHIESLYYKGVLFNKPGSVVIAAGGIPDELKIKGATYLTYPSPVRKVRKDLLEDPATRVKAFDDAYKQIRGREAFGKAIIEAYQKAHDKFHGRVPPRSEEEGHQRPLAMIEVNIVIPRRETRSSSDKRIKDTTT